MAGPGELRDLAVVTNDVKARRRDEPVLTQLGKRRFRIEWMHPGQAVHSRIPWHPLVCVVRIAGVQTWASNEVSRRSLSK